MPFELLNKRQFIYAIVGYCVYKHVRCDVMTLQYIIVCVVVVVVVVRVANIYLT